MLIVMLILLMATAMASVSLQATQTELRSAGNLRNSVQTQYAAEAAMSTTMAWVDATSLSGEFFTTQLEGWNAHAAPAMEVFGEPAVSATNRGYANRTQWEQQRKLPYETAPLTVRGGTVISGRADSIDAIGTFGPRTQYVPGLQMAAVPGKIGKKPEDIVDYVVDMYDCQQLPVTASAGSLINDIGSGVPQQFQIYCVITSRGRSYVPYPDGAAADDRRITKTWALGPASTPPYYTASRFSAAHDARGTLVTPPILK